MRLSVGWILAGHRHERGAQILDGAWPPERAGFTMPLSKTAGFRAGDRIILKPEHHCFS